VVVREGRVVVEVRGARSVGLLLAAGWLAGWERMGLATGDWRLERGLGSKLRA
jgi:hypothetical protein